MKKNLIAILALVFVLGIAGTAFAAANPFVDVPARHWAYDAVSKLAKAGILDGYGDGTYRGERLASRYEMAQATAKAMARADKADAQMKALIDKLAVEFAAELNNLGVRVAKLEKNASSIKFWGDSRIRFMQNAVGTFDLAGNTAASFWDQRLRVYAKADLNDKAAFYGRIMANWTDSSVYSTSRQSSIYWDYGYFEWTMNPNFKVAVGRQQLIGAFDLFYTNGGYDSIQLKFGAPSDRFQAKVGYGDVGTYSRTGSPVTNAATKPIISVDATYKLSDDWAINGAMFYSTNADKATNSFLTDAGINYIDGYYYQVYALSAQGKLNSDMKLTTSFFWNAYNGPSLSAVTDQKNGWVTELWYKGADKAKVGSWGLAVNYRNIKPFAMDLAMVSGMLANSLTSDRAIWYGSKGWGFQANYTISKNAVLTATYETLSANNIWTGNKDTRYLPFYYLQLNVNF